MALVAKAIRAGIFNDLGSGSNVDVCIIRKDGVDYRRNMEFLQVGCRLPCRLCAGSAPCMSWSTFPLHVDAPETAALQSLLDWSCLAWQDKTYSRAKPVQHAPGTAGRFTGLLQPPAAQSLHYTVCLIVTLQYSAEVRAQRQSCRYFSVCRCHPGEGAQCHQVGCCRDHCRRAD